MLTHPRRSNLYPSISPTYLTARARVRVVTVPGFQPDLLG